ncbi:MAG: hypothetical protein IOD12_02165 [Silvanigrellales bacterium]|jgi:transcriptional regulator with XRE-family HTH domain|nr:hypothetical protein [Silvanigrellales bacterium]
MNVDLEMAHVLSKAPNAGVALSGIFAVAKARRKSLSLASFAARAALSKSYVSEVMSGKKRLNPRYVATLAQALKLGLLETACFDALAKRDSNKNELTREEYEENLRKARRILMLLSLADSPPANDALLVFDIYASLSLFRSPPTYASVAALFSEKEPQRVYRALDVLVQSESLLKSADGVLRYSEKGMVHNAIRNSDEFVSFWQASLDDAKASVATQAERKEVSCFLSYSVSVDRKRYVLALEMLKNTIFEFATGIEAQEGDTLVRINLQVYPTLEQ